VDELRELRSRIERLADLGQVAALLEWDQLVMMPVRAAEPRAAQVGTLARIRHEMATGEELGRLLDELSDAELDPVDADIARLARRDYDRAVRVPAELAAELASGAAAGQKTWERARAADDFTEFLPALERNIELARDYAGHVADPGQSRYDALLADYDFGLTSETIAALFARLGEVLPGLVAEAPASDAALEVPLEGQKQAVGAILARLGVEPSSWRVDVSAHPFSTGTARLDQRITTRYSDGGVEAIGAAIHEFGHALYERQIDPALDRTNLATGTSMSVHESQSKFWENHIGRSRAFAEVIAGELRSAGTEVSADDYFAAANRVAATPIRVSSDPVSYSLHIVLRFELERAMIEGELAAADLPGEWRSGMKRLLGIDVKSDAEGCMQDVHWSGGSFGYFPSYALGGLIAAQVWEAIVAALGPLDGRLRAGETDEIKGWLAENIHRFGRRLDTVPVIEHATGRGLDPEPFLRYAESVAAG
jgi:carboxypeptidase Taq